VADAVDAYESVWTNKYSTPSIEYCLRTPNSKRRLIPVFYIDVVGRKQLRLDQFRLVLQPALVVRDKPEPLEEQPVLELQMAHLGVGEETRVLPFVSSYAFLLIDRVCHFLKIKHFQKKHACLYHIRNVPHTYVT